MRVTLDISAEILQRGKRRAAHSGAPLHRVVENALQLYLGGKAPPSRHYRLRWKTESGRLLPGVRLDDPDALFDVMEGR